MTDSKEALVAKLTAKLEIGRIEAMLNELSAFTDSSKPGLTRLGYTETDMRGKNYIARKMHEAGLEVSVSPIGNTFGKLSGAASDAHTVLTGSHTDTVINAGRFDGIIGVVCAIEVLRVLSEVRNQLAHAITVVDWTLEEATRFGLCHLGSKVFVGERISVEDLSLKDAQGCTIAEALRAVELLEKNTFRMQSLDAFESALNAVQASRGTLSNVHSYLELHIEQAGSLEETGYPIGVVNAAAGPTRWAVHITGEQAHSGSTPMNRRHNALLAAAEFVLTVERLCQLEAPKGTVGTVTMLNVEPNAMNTVPGKCELFLDLRSTDAASKSRIKEQLLRELQTLSKRYGVSIDHSVITDEEPVIFSKRITSAVERSCAALSIPYVIVPSRAGHDACTIAAGVEATGMIFVPSKNGISHHPDEWTDSDAILIGTRVLLATLLDLAMYK